MYEEHCGEFNAEGFEGLMASVAEETPKIACSSQTYTVNTDSASSNASTQLPPSGYLPNLVVERGCCIQADGSAWPIKKHAVDFGIRSKI